ncbi:4Fe-4S cluster-binding domain-containing protein [Parasulfuritortus cantonensis]|uniref:4Fe-4S cluster-binding domain-containing protein n=1 Tax=Parasulfuritortus cantonensis TaxID=2528202 RepID=A0A4R1BGP3_9PROT|nr:4Fe-4S cluster-binding domain-containing protein [Parasulfuritortus cantonensis]TCJ16369.1 4Fe-4S cluster-binding domain-containing protein [Parasulfuritortus cantonensis]
MRYIKNLAAIPALRAAGDLATLERVGAHYAFRSSEYYLGLIDWSDPADPIRQLIVPRAEELDAWGDLDACNEAAVTISHGVQHKYADTVLLLCNEVCGGYCRYCFRKRLFMDDNEEVNKAVWDGLDYIAGHPEVTNVLLTGGDPLLMSTRRLAEIIGRLREIPHVQVIRIGSKMPAFDPWRILDDPELLAMFERHSTAEKRIYVMAHFDHPRELTEPAVRALDQLIRHGVVLTNQCPLIAGINDDPVVLGELYRKLSWLGCPPYYLFQGRPTAGNAPYRVPIVRGWQTFQEAIHRGSGLARRARYVMSHESGKIEILAVDETRIYLRYHRAKDPALRGRFMIYHRNDAAYWLDDLDPVDAAFDVRFGHDSLYETAAGPE